jgi:putative Ca2+/H+ antiporter (TMEM165/GDT1 family)
MYAGEAGHPKLTVFLAARAALVLTSALGVLAGTALSHTLDPKLLRWVAGLGFVAIGLYTLARA